MPDDNPPPKYPNGRKEPSKVRINWSKPTAPPIPKSPGALLIAHERDRQVEKEGYTPTHDNTHSVPQLAEAGAAYALECLPPIVIDGNMLAPIFFWPFERSSFKPKNLRRNLERAGALIAAALDRLIDEEYKDIKFYWIGEDTEIFACRNLSELHSYLSPEWVKGSGTLMNDGTRGHFEESKIVLSESNKGEEWGDADGDQLVDIEDIGIMTMRGFAAYIGFEHFPVQVASSYT
jgi:hypothetical protein